MPTLQEIIQHADQSFFKYELNNNMRIETRTVDNDEMVLLVISDDFFKACGLNPNLQNINADLLTHDTIGNNLFKKYTDNPNEHCYSIPFEAFEDSKGMTNLINSAIKKKLQTQYHETLMKNNKSLTPFFLASNEMKKKLDKKLARPHNSDALLKDIEKFNKFKTTMQDIARIEEAVANNTAVTLSIGYGKKTYSADALKKENILGKYLQILHNQSQDSIIAGNVKLIGTLLLVAAALTMAALIIAAFTIMMTPGVFISAAIAVPLIFTSLASGFTGAIFSEAPQHFTTIGRLMHKHYNFFKQKHIKQNNQEEANSRLVIA